MANVPLQDEDGEVIPKGQCCRLNDAEQTVHNTEALKTRR